MRQPGSTGTDSTSVASTYFLKLAVLIFLFVLHSTTWHCDLIRVWLAHNAILVFDVPYQAGQDRKRVDPGVCHGFLAFSRTHRGVAHRCWEATKPPAATCCTVCYLPRPQHPQRRQSWKPAKQRCDSPGEYPLRPCDDKLTDTIEQTQSNRACAHRRLHRVR